jgi:hypothetical protein
MPAFPFLGLARSFRRNIQFPAIQERAQIGIGSEGVAQFTPVLKEQGGIDSKTKRARSETGRVGPIGGNSTELRD